MHVLIGGSDSCAQVLDIVRGVKFAEIKDWGDLEICWLFGLLAWLCLGCLVGCFLCFVISSDTGGALVVVVGVWCFSRCLPVFGLGLLLDICIYTQNNLVSIYT